MADYFAVLNRTLSGFSDPKPALRGKLYERARDTIARQLELRRPTMDDETIAAELAKLEAAIAEIESGFGDDEAAPPLSMPPVEKPIADTPSPPAESVEPLQEIEPQPETPQTVDDFSSDVVLVDPVNATDEADDALRDADEPKQAEVVPVFDRGDTSTSLRDILSNGESGENDAGLDSMAETLAPVEDRMFEPQQPVGEPALPVSDDAPSFDEAVPDLAAGAVVAEASDATPIDETAKSNVDAVEAWADEFLAMQPSQTASVPQDKPLNQKSSEPVSADAPVSNEDPIERTEASVEEISRTVESFTASTLPLPDMPETQPASDVVTPMSVAPTPAASAPAPTASRAPLPSVERDTPLTIPPAPTYADTRKSRVVKRRRSGLWTWLGLVLLALIALLAMVFLLPQAAPYRDGAIRTLGLQNSLGTYFEDPAVRPTPVKTIPIVPPVDDGVEEDPPETVQPAVKREERLEEDGTEVTPEPVVEPTVVPDPVDPVVEPIVEPDAPAVDETAAAEPVAEVETPVPVLEGPSAILYEEGTSQGENSFDAGAVRWNLTQEDIGAGTTEPVINGRMDIPGRNVVLLLTIKRNVDAALPASHLIELIFAVPDDFSGGAIADINRFVMKESEQSRGENLVGVPAKLGDGLFLIALNNLDQARATNVNLLSTRGWIDIPLQYRTTRRALVTLEKGAEGTRVFSEAFDAWSKL